MSRILVIVPAKPQMHAELKRRCMVSALAMLEANRHEMAFLFDWTSEAKQPGDATPWSVVARVRNRIVDGLSLDRWDYLLWIDADVIDYPADLPTRLIQSNPEGVSAPMVLIEDSARLFYDFAGFIIRGRDHVRHDTRMLVRGRNLSHEPPYWPIEPTQDVVEMDCVGCVMMVPAAIYRAGGRYEDHPLFTDHYPICRKAREMGRRVTVCRSLVTTHANLPKYGEAWH